MVDSTADILHKLREGAPSVSDSPCMTAESHDPEVAELQPELTAAPSPSMSNVLKHCLTPPTTHDNKK